MPTIGANRLGILSSSYLHNHPASRAVSAPQQRPRDNREQGVVALKIRTTVVAARLRALAAAAAAAAPSCSEQRLLAVALAGSSALATTAAALAGSIQRMPPRSWPSLLRLFFVHG